MPDVWLKYAKADPDSPIDLILTPKAGHAPGAIAVMLQDRLRHYHDGRKKSAPDPGTGPDRLQLLIGGRQDHFHRN